jgi:hypothetical protein
LVDSAGYGCVQRRPCESANVDPESCQHIPWLLRQRESVEITAAVARPLPSGLEYQRPRRSRLLPVPEHDDHCSRLQISLKTPGVLGSSVFTRLCIYMGPVTHQVEIRLSNSINSMLRINHYYSCGFNTFLLARLNVLHRRFIEASKHRAIYHWSVVLDRLNILHRRLHRGLPALPQSVARTVPMPVVVGLRFL